MHHFLPDIENQKESLRKVNKVVNAIENKKAEMQYFIDKAFEWHKGENNLELAKSLKTKLEDQKVSLISFIKGVIEFTITDFTLPIEINDLPQFPENWKLDKLRRRLDFETEIVHGQKNRIVRRKIGAFDTGKPFRICNMPTDGIGTSSPTGQSSLWYKIRIEDKNKKQIFLLKSDGYKNNQERREFIRRTMNWNADPRREIPRRKHFFFDYLPKEAHYVSVELISSGNIHYWMLTELWL